MLAGILIVLVILVAAAYMLVKPKLEVKPKVGLTEETGRAIDSAIQQEMDSTLANVSQDEIEQSLLS
jgi:hypothetical protein